MKIKIVSFDFETTGIPNWKIPSDSEEQPHIVELGAILADASTGKIHSKLSFIVKPDGWTIPQETIDVHGITNEMADEQGIPEKDVANHLLSLCEQSNFNRCCHNRTFDQRIFRIALKRYRPEMLDRWAEKDNFTCTMWGSKDLCKIPKKSGKGYKLPTLSEAHEILLGEPVYGAHRAITDAEACLDIFLAIQNKI